MKFTVSGKPKGKGRPRVAMRTGTVYTPKATVDYENKVKAEFFSQCGNTRFPDNEPIAIEITAYFSVPKNDSKAVKASKLAGHPTGRPDLDNILKIILDALNGIAYRDDAQVTDCTVKKRYAEDPRVEVVLQNMKDENRKEEKDVFAGKL